MQFTQPFDARQVEPASFAPPPPLADYHVRIVESEAKPTTDQTGGYLQFDLEILDPGPQQAKKVPYRLNLFNKNQQTVEIAYRQLSALCHVTGVFNVQDSRQLHNIPFIATIGPQTNNPTYSNVFQVKDINGNVPGQKTAGPVGAPPPVPAPPSAAPPAWAPPTNAVPPAAPAPAWGAPPAVAPPPAWAPGPPQQPATAPAPPVWTPPGAPAPAAAAPAPAWGAPAGAPAPAPPWAK